MFKRQNRNFCVSGDSEASVLSRRERQRRSVLSKTREAGPGWGMEGLQEVLSLATAGAERRCPLPTRGWCPVENVFKGWEGNGTGKLMEGGVNQGENAFTRRARRGIWLVLSHAEQQIHDANQHTLTEHLLNVIYSFSHKHSLSTSTVLDSGSESDSVWALKAHDLLLGRWRGVVDSCTNIVSTTSLL